MPASFRRKAVDILHMKDRCLEEVYRLRTDMQVVMITLCSRHDKLREAANVCTGGQRALVLRRLFDPERSMSLVWKTCEGHLEVESIPAKPTFLLSDDDNNARDELETNLLDVSEDEIDIALDSDCQSDLSDTDTV